MENFDKQNEDLNTSENENDEIEAIKPSVKIFGKIFTIIAYILVFVLGYQVATVSYTGQFGNVPGTTISQMNTIEDLVKKYYYKDYNKNNLYDYATSFMVYGLEDPYSYHLDETDLKEYEETIEGAYVGVGLSLAPSENGQIMVVSPFDSSPAQKAGILKNDIIVKVNGNEYSYKESEEAIRLMKGKKGETVELEIKREGVENFTVTLTKDEIIYTSISSEKIEEDTVYVRISRFDINTYEDFTKELSKYNIDENINLILDVRDNPGGTVNTAVSIADLFLDEGVIITEKYKNQKDVTEKSDEAYIKVKYPIIMLTNSSSASASEILAGSLKDREKAILIGEKTYGKGLINQRFEIDSKNSIVLSVAEYLTPNGTKIHGVGIEPHKEVISEHTGSILTLEKEDDIQLNAALEYIKEHN
ncbi:MAG: S41 family peptidase [Ruminococcaceae bacterium]|nr:S41 family peptidase [Oscillospiraceae bacterium]